MASGFNRKMPDANKPLTAISIAAVVDNYVAKIWKLKLICNWPFGMFWKKEFNFWC